MKNGCEMILKELFERFFIIHKCGGCREILDHEDFSEALCPECRLKWRVAKTESCPVCAQSAVECTCMPKTLAKTGALCLRKLNFYHAYRDKEPQNRLIYFLKKNPNKRMADFVARELSVQIREELSALGADSEDAVVVNIPRGHRSRRIYGFDQSAFICKRLAELSGIEYTAAILRRRGGKEQKQLDRSKRMENTESRFTVGMPDGIKEKYVILFDDVVTTGASMSACASALRKAGAKGIICLCMAQVPKNPPK